MGFRRVNGALHHWTENGREGAPLLVFSNSLGSDLRIWDEVVAALEDRWRILRYDSRGHGLSDAPSGPYAVDGLADDLLALLDARGAGPFALVGLSVGGLIAQAVAARRPEQLAALVLCDTAPKIGGADLWNARIAAVETGGLESIADAVMARWFTPGFSARQEEAAAGWRNMLLRTPAAGYAGTCAALRDADLTSAAAALRVPTLCLVGAEDLSTPPEMVRWTAETIPGAGFETIADAGHLPCIEQPAATAALIARHLTEAGFV